MNTQTARPGYKFLNCKQCGIRTLVADDTVSVTCSMCTLHNTIAYQQKGRAGHLATSEEPSSPESDSEFLEGETGEDPDPKEKSTEETEPESETETENWCCQPCQAENEPDNQSCLVCGYPRNGQSELEQRLSLENGKGEQK